MRRWIPAAIALLAACALAPATAAEEETRDERAEARKTAEDLAVLMVFHGDAGRFAEAIAKGRESARLHAAAGDAERAARVLTEVGSYCLKGGRQAEAVRVLQSALAVQRDLGDAVGACLSLNLLARTALLGPSPAEAVAWLKEGFDLVLARDLRGPYFLLANTAEKARSRLRADLPAPKAYFALLEADIAFRHGAGWPHQAERLMDERIFVLARDGRRDEAADAVREMISFQEVRGYRWGVAFGWHKLGLVLAEDASLGADRFERADEAYRLAQTIRDEIDDGANLAWTLNNRGYLRLLQKQYEAARTFFEKAVPLFDATHVLDGLRTAWTNLRETGRQAGWPALTAEADRALQALEKRTMPPEEPFSFSPERTALAYYLFLRERDRTPVVEIRGGAEELFFTVVSTSETFRVPVDPRPKAVKISFEAPASFFSKEKPAVAVCTFHVTGGRAVAYGQSFLFLAKGSCARADREDNLRLGPAQSPDVLATEAETESWAYPSTASPGHALRTMVEAVRRGEWEAFEGTLSPFARGWLDRESFEATAEKQAAVPLAGISILEAKRRNPAWVEIRYSYEADPGSASPPESTEEERQAAMDAYRKAFEKEYGENRYRAFLVRTARGWRVDFLDKD